MNTLGKVALGALAGAVTLGTIAGIYCKFFKDDNSETDCFSELESNGMNEQESSLDDKGLPIRELCGTGIMHNGKIF